MPGLPWLWLLAAVGLVSVRMNAAELAMPAITVHRGLITRGKPHPEEYLLAVELLGVQPQDPVG